MGNICQAQQDTDMSRKWVDVAYDVKSKELVTPSGVIGSVKVRNLEVTDELVASEASGGVEAGTYEPTMTVSGATKTDNAYPHNWSKNGTAITVSGSCEFNTITAPAGVVEVTVDLPEIAVRSSLTQGLHGTACVRMQDVSAPASDQTYPGFVELLYDNYPDCNHFRVFVSWNRDGTFDLAPTASSFGRFSWTLVYMTSL